MKKFYRSKSNIKLDGICVGLEDYFDTDPFFMEIIIGCFIFYSNSYFLIYLITTLIISTKTEK